MNAKSDKPFFMDVNFIKMHNPTNAAPAFRGKSHLGDYSDSLMEMDADIGRIMDEIRADAPNTIVILTADNGAWLDAYPDAGTTPFRGEKGSPFEGGWRVPGLMWWPGHIQAGGRFDEMMSHIDCWATLAAMVGLTPPPHDWVGNDGKPIYASTTAPTSSARRSTRRGLRGSTSTARYSKARAPTSAAIPSSPGCTLLGNTF
jgi:arylsulfatase A-like enzyme